jgi:hypothetical protein
MCVDLNGRRCWKAKDLKNPAFTKQTGVSVIDEVATDSVDLKGVGFYCPPAEIDGDPIADADPRQCCYKVKGATLKPSVSIQVAGSVGGTLKLKLLKPSLLCEQCVGAPADNPLRCWKVKDLKDPVFVRSTGVSIHDELANDAVDVLKPELYCAPAGVNGSPIFDSLAQQCCYKVKGAKLAAASTINTIGSVGGTLQLGVQQQGMICEPCTASVLP